jgi:hypothetical protein
MTITRLILLFGLAALFDIGVAWLVWQGWHEHRGLWWIAAGIIAPRRRSAYPYRWREAGYRRRSYP